MNIKELNRFQLKEAKTNYWAEKNGEDISYGEISDIDNLVSDDEIFKAYGDIDFSEDDFADYENEEDRIRLIYFFHSHGDHEFEKRIRKLISTKNFDGFMYAYAYDEEDRLPETAIDDSGCWYAYITNQEHFNEIYKCECD